TFWFTATFDKQPGKQQPDFAGLEDLQGRPVLVVDDNATNRLVLKEQLKSWECKFEEAGNGEEALEKLRKASSSNEPFSVVIVDMQIPGIDGKMLGKKIQADAAISDVKMVMMTAVGERGDAADFRKIGFAAYLVKPVKKSLLRDCLLALFGRGSMAEDQGTEEMITRHSINDDKKQQTRILVVDDSETNLLVAKGVLGKLGYCSVDTAENGIKAVEALEKTAYDLVLMDVQMPEMDGLEATKAIRDTSSDVLNHAVPIIAMTAHAMKKDRDICLEAGMDDYISKPLNRRDLAETIKSRLSSVTQLEPTDPGPFADAPVKSVFNKAEIMERFDGDEELIAKLMNSFAKNVLMAFTELQEALDKNNAEAVCRSGHTIKGISANVSADAMREVALLVEESGEAGDIARAAELFEDLKKEFGRFADVLQNEINP
ncbi:MAG: response regulator, partial [Deltaproteobacteria bacterium]|nr:response regulator [Deltaproteobacteria bacterium]